jgi:type I restriction enzyme, R subunit
LSREDDEYKKEKILEKLEKSESVEMEVIVSQDADEIEKMAVYDIDMKEIRGRLKQKTTDGKSSLLETEFKNPDSNLRIVFVCAMWLTGFDVPNLSTLYLDKPLRNHTLMQTIARANRVSEGKTNGLIVDYIGVFKNLQKALALYASTGGEEFPISPKSDLVEKLERELAGIEEFLESKDILLSRFFEADEQEKILLLERSANIILENSSVKKSFLGNASDLYQTYLSVLPDPRGEEFYLKVIIIKTIAHRVRTVGSKSIDISAVQEEMEELLDKSI